MPEVEAGKWYVTVKCPACERSFALQALDEAPHLGQRVSIPAQPTPCPFCGHEEAYTLDQIRFLQGTYKQ